MHSAEKVLLQDAIDITAGKSWAKKGYTIKPLFEPALFEVFKKSTTQLIFELWAQAGLQFDDSLLPEAYHTLLKSNEDHLRAIENTKLITVEKFPIAIQLIEERISEICEMPLHVKNPFDHQSVFHFRVVRPQSNDNNPLHRDVWLEDYDNCINIYIPVAGSNELSSLSLIPESHWWPESRIERTQSGALLNGVKFNVPAVTSIKQPYQLIRPNPQENEVLVFSPYLIHGGAINHNKNLTRISLEIRFWKKDSPKRNR